MNKEMKMKKFEKLDKKNISELQRNFAKKMILIRDGKEISQEAMAEFLNTTVDSIINYENGDTLPNLDTIQAIAEKFNVPVDYLITKEDDEGYKIGYGYAYLEALGLNPLNTLAISKCTEDEICKMIFNYMFQEGFVYQLINLIKNNIMYRAIYSEMTNTDKSAAQSIDNIKQFLIWKNTNKLSDDILNISKEISKKLPKDFVKTKMNKVENETDDFSDLMDMIEDKFDIFQKLENLE